MSAPLGQRKKTKLLVSSYFHIYVWGVILGQVRVNEPPPPQRLEKGEKLLWKYKETRYFVFFHIDPNFLIYIIICQHHSEIICFAYWKAYIYYYIILITRMFIQLWNVFVCQCVSSWFMENIIFSDKSE